jgi:ABC-type microcin C transport system duplicated ATPase subunit YejF
MNVYEIVGMLHEFAVQLVGYQRSHVAIRIAAMEQPNVLAADIAAFFRGLR